MKSKTSLAKYLILGLILLLALALRLWGINFGLPHLFAKPDEQILVRIALDLFINRNLNPHFFIYPSTFIYLLYVVYSLFYLLAKLGGYFQSFADFWLLFLKEPAIFFILPRYISLIASLLTILVIYKLGRRFYSPSTGLIAAFWGAGTFLLVREAHFGVTDTLLTLLCTLAVYRMLGLYEWGRRRDFILTAFISGLAVSTKYPAALLLFPLITGLIFRFKREENLKYFYNDIRFWLLVTLGFISFLGASPYIILDYKNFYKNFMFLVDSSAINPGGTSTGYWYNLRFILFYGLGWPLLLLSGIGLFSWIFRRRPKDLIIISFVLGYFLVMGLSEWPFARYLLPIIPLIIVMAADSLVNAAAYLFKENEKLKQSFLSLLSVFIILPSLLSLISFNRILARADTRVQAQEWMEKHLPAGSIIAIDGLFYNNLGLVEIPDQMQARVDQMLPNFFEKYISSNFNHLFSKPAFEIYVISDFYSNILEVSAEQKSSREEAFKLYQRIKELKVQYLVTSEYKYLPLFSDNWVRLKPALNSKMRLIKRINPENYESKVIPLFDQVDAFYVPYTGFKAIKYPGPQINIYKLY